MPDETRFRSCGSSLVLRTQFNALLADYTLLRTAFVALTAKLDADTGITDTDYAATMDPTAITALTLTTF